MDELQGALADFDRDETIGAIVITGSERAFAAGADVAAMKDWSYMHVYKTNSSLAIGNSCGRFASH